MSITPEQHKTIEEEMARLAKTDYLRPKKKVTRFLEDYSCILAQATRDLEALEGAGFDGTLMPKYYDYLETLFILNVERVTTAGDSEQKEEFDRQMVIAREDTRRLRKVARHIWEETKSERIQKIRGETARKRSAVEILAGNIALAQTIRDFPDLACTICIGGRKADRSYLDEVIERAEKLLELRGETEKNASPVSAAVDRRDRALTLCIRAFRDIKKAARNAFLFDLEYYYERYVRRFKRKSSGKGSDEFRPEEQVLDQDSGT